ncbi:MAG TPA: hypothetical protein VN688_21025 [Gemmataceae bacterium]|nr:hypothetical protein [Gemmataceae bacterium]
MRVSRQPFFHAGVLTSLVSTMLFTGCNNKSAAKATSEPEPASVTLRYRWQPCGNHVYRIFSKNNAVDRVESVSNRTKVRVVVDLALNVVEAATDGNALIDTRVLHYGISNVGRRKGLEGMELSVPLRGAGSFPVQVGGVTETCVIDDRVQVIKDGISVGDNKSRNPIARGVGEALQESLPRLFGSRAEIVHSPLGRCVIRKRAGDYFAADLADGPVLSPVSLLGLRFPRQPVRPGDTWQATYRVTRLGQHEILDGGLQGTVTFCLKPEAVPEKPGWVRVAVSDSLQFKNGKRRMKFHLLKKTYDRELIDLQRTCAGEILFDPAAGMVMAAKLQTKTTARFNHLLPDGQRLPHVDRSDCITEVSLLGK